MVVLVDDEVGGLARERACVEGSVAWDGEERGRAGEDMVF